MSDEYWNDEHYISNDYNSSSSGIEFDENNEPIDLREASDVQAKENIPLIQKEKQEQKLSPTAYHYAQINRYPKQN